MSRGSGDITDLLNAPDLSRAAQLWELVYPELRRRAKNLLRSERPDHTLSATALINETYVRLATNEPREWKDRSHFYAVASGIMRHALIDHARARAASKRGGGAARTTLDESVFPAVEDSEAGFRVAEEALERLAEKHERASLVVAMRVFGGLTVEEVAAELGVSERTVKADWMVARARLQRILAEG